MGKLMEFKEWLYTLDKREIIKLLDFAFGFKGLIKGDRILNILKKFVSDAKIEDLEIEFTATAFDLAHEREVVSQLETFMKQSGPQFLSPEFSLRYCREIYFGGWWHCEQHSDQECYQNRQRLVSCVNVNAEATVHKPSLLIQDKNNGRSLNYFDLVDNTIASATNQLSQMIIERYPPEILIEISRKSAGTF